MKKPVLVFTAADDKNIPLAKQLENSFKKFHPDIPFHTVQGEELQEYIKIDPEFFYMQKPVLMEKYLKEYELVIGIDADSIVCGDLSYIWETKDYDVATVMNWNRVDPQIHGVVQGWGISPVEYFNCGLVAARSADFVHKWFVACHSPQFERLQYREQDILNILCYYGNYNIRCLDHGDGPAGMYAWWGLVAKGEWLKAKVVDDKIVVPKGDDNFPSRDTELKVLHIAGGGPKPSYKTLFSEEVIQRLNHLVKSEAITK